MSNILLDDCNQLEFRCNYRPCEYMCAVTHYSGDTPELPEIQIQAILMQWVRWYDGKS